MKSNKLPGSFGLLWDLQDSYLGELPSPANKYKHIVIKKTSTLSRSLLHKFLI